jgi:hypothetical protein
MLFSWTSFASVISKVLLLVLFAAIGVCYFMEKPAAE